MIPYLGVFSISLCFLSLGFKYKRKLHGFPEDSGEIFRKMLKVDDQEHVRALYGWRCLQQILPAEGPFQVKKG